MSYCAYGSGFVKFLPITEEEAATQVTRLLRHVRKDFSIDGITDKQSASLKLEAMLCGILKKIAYGVDIDDQTGSIADSLCVDLSFNGNYNKDSWASSLDLLSPIVEAGEICFIGEDDSHFRLIFRDGTWAGDNGHVCWDGSFNMQNCIFAHSHSDEVPDCYTPEENNPYPLCTGQEKEPCASCNLWKDFDTYSAPDPYRSLMRRLKEEPLQHRNDITYIMDLCEEAAEVIEALSGQCRAAQNAMLLLACGKCCSICSVTDCQDKGNPSLCSSFQWNFLEERKE